MRRIGELGLIIYMHTYMYTCKNIHTDAHTCTHTYIYSYYHHHYHDKHLKYGKKNKNSGIFSMLWVLWCPTVIVWNFSGTTFPWSKCSWTYTIQLDKSTVFYVACLWFRNQAMAKLSQRWPKCPKCWLCRCSVFWTLRGYKRNWEKFSVKQECERWSGS